MKLVVMIKKDSLASDNKRRCQIERTWLKKEQYGNRPYIYVRACSLKLFTVGMGHIRTLRHLLASMTIIGCRDQTLLESCL